MPIAVSVTPPEVIGVLGWWSVMLAGPVLLIRRRRRRHGAASSDDTRRPRRRLRKTLAARPTEALGDPGLGEAGQGTNSRAAGRREEQLQAPGVEISVPAEPAQRGRDGGPRPSRGLPSQTLEPLCRFVDFRRRLELAACELERKLAPLPHDRWRIEPYPLTGERRNTLLILGETGVFVVSATYAPGHWDDVIAVDRLARKMQLLLPGYAGLVQPAICHPFTVAQPRIWHRPDEHGDWIGAWLIGGDSVIKWLEHFGTEHGLEPADIQRFDQLTKANWLKPAIGNPPSWPPIPAAPPGAGA